MKIAFLDTVGLRYDGDTLNHRGLGGSESAIIYLSRELVKIGFDVTVFNKVEKEGTYDGVKYKSNKTINTEYFDILISSRSAIPYVPIQFREKVLLQERQDVNDTITIVQNSGYKVLWLHDTFCSGDSWVEHLVVDGFIDEIFTLSDWHSNYIMNGHQWRGRIFEVLKKKTFQTRNGLCSYVDNVDITKKDKNQFVYNSSVTKGMVPLIEECWSKIKEQIPEAKLKIIGGYYRGANNDKPDKQEMDFHDLREKHDGKNGIEFTGIIRQQEIAKILSESSLMVYPCIFPETYGISTLEAINYNTPLVGCRFGALEEVGTEKTSYLINYNYDYDQNQIFRFVDMVVKAYKDDYLRQQKMYACNEFKPYIGWDSVALQWKEHLYRKLGLYLNVEEIRRVRKINNKIINLFGRRYLNPEDTTEYNFYKHENKIVVVSPFYNSASYLDKVIKSVASQDYDNYIHVLINDVSDDNSVEVINNTLKDLSEVVRNKVKFIYNSEKRYALQNQYEAIKRFSKDKEDIIILLDGDDWLINDPDIFNFINNQYNEGAEFTYGSCYSLADDINLISQPYPEEIHENKAYRKHLFNWGMPYTHLRTFKKYLFDRVPVENLLDEGGQFYRAGNDNALFYSLLENASDYHNIICNQRVLCVYNDTNPLNDYKVNSIEQNKNAENIRSVNVSEDIDKIKEINMSYDKENNVYFSNSLYQIYEDVKKRDSNAVRQYKQLLKERAEVWIDDANGSHIKIREDWIVNKLIELNIPKTAKILDVGAWTGSFANEIYKSGFTNITCLDIADKCVEVGKNVYPQFNWIQGDIEVMNLREVYDVIIMAEVIEHLINPFETIEKIKSSLSKDGFIIYTIPTEETVYGEEEQFAVEHVSKITKEELSKYSNDIYVIESNIFFDWYAGTIRNESVEPVHKIINPTSQEKKLISAEPEVKNKKKILIALPTAKDVETSTMKSIYDLIIPEDCEKPELQFFFGYRIDQVRNLICHWASENKFDYVFFVDSDIVLPANSLLKLIRAKKDIITGTYIQRKHNVRIPEIYVDINGGIDNINIDVLNTKLDTFEIAGCGFGCCLVSIESIRKIGYPQFEYHHAIKMEDTLSEDIDFCIKARKNGIKMFCDPSIKCDHIGTNIFKI